MFLKDIQARLDQTREDSYRLDRNDSFQAIEVRAVDPNIGGYVIGNLICSIISKDSSNNLNWIKVDRAIFNETFSQIQTEDVHFFYVEGDYDSENEVELDIVSNNEGFIYFEPIKEN